MNTQSINRTEFLHGLRDGTPIGLGYLAVGFAVGIAARNAGLNAFQGFLISFMNHASAGEYAGITVIAAMAPYYEIVIITLIANVRYMLMSAALSQKFSSETAFFHRLTIGFFVTDELFGLGVSSPGYLKPRYMYGAIIVAATGWELGTVLGVVIGDVLPPAAVSAFSVALFGMFIAIIIPPAKRDKKVLACVITGFAASYICSVLPRVSDLSDGMRTIILTVVISVIAAALFPIAGNERSGEADHE